jgi:type II secretory pathway component GspD/PulD (secretin)
MFSRPIRRTATSITLSFLMLSVGSPAGLSGQSANAPQKEGPPRTTVAAPPTVAQTVLRPDPKRAEKAVERGQKAETQGRLEDALAAYDEAVRYAPQNVEIVSHAAELRSSLVRSHVDNAERLALAGHIPDALDSLREALRIDPTNSIVVERAEQMRAMETAEPRNTEIPGLPTLKLQSGTRSFDVRGDTKSAYDQITSAFGIKAAFDPDLASRTVRFKVADLDFNTAMILLGEQSGTFWRPLSQDLIFVAQDTQEKRRRYGVEAEQSFSMSGTASPEEMTELLRAIREITGSTHVELNAGSHTLTMRDTPERLNLTNQLMEQLQQGRGEIMLDIKLLEVDRNKARQLGITPPSSAQAFFISPNDIKALSQAADVANALTILGQLFSAQGISSIPGFLLFGGGASTFLLTIPGAAANFSDALTLVKSGRQVLLRAQDGKPATFFVGDRYPVTLSLLSGSLGTGSGTGTAATSFTGIPSSTSFPETVFNVGNNPVALAAAPFSGGTLPDLAVANKNDNTISILTNQDNGNFTTNPSIVLGSSETAPVAIAAGAFGNTFTDSTGVTQLSQDLVIANSTSNNVTVLLGNGNGTFQVAPGSPFAVGTNPSSVVIADFNGDGNLDFAVANEGDNTISVFKGNGSGGFTQFPSSPFALQNTTSVSEKGPIALATANFRNLNLNSNNSNLPALPEVDLAVANSTSNNVSILLGAVDTNGNISFTEASGSPIAVGNLPVAIAAGDLNADGIPDLAVVNQTDNTISILLGSSNADGTFVAAAGSPLATAATPAGIVIANFTGGAVPSLAVTNQGAGTLGIYVGLGSGTFSNRLEIAAPTSPSAIISATLTSSGLPDVAFTALGNTANQGVVTIVQDSSSFANGTVPGQTPYPGAEYIDLGVKVKATPSVHPDRQVTLQLEFEIRALAGSSVNGIPVISNRTLTQTVRLKEDETSVIGGLLDKEQTRGIVGIPGLATLPGIGYAFGTRSTSKTDNEFLILVTPRRLRTPVHSTTSIFAGRGDPTTRGSIGAGAPTNVEDPSEQPGPPPTATPQPAPNPPANQPPPQNQSQPANQPQPPPHP